MSLST